MLIGLILRLTLPTLADLRPLHISNDSVCGYKTNIEKVSILRKRYNDYEEFLDYFAVVAIKEFTLIACSIVIKLKSNN